MTSNLSGKGALIVGGSSGIGAAVARRFAERGARVVINYNANEAGAAETVAAIRAAGGVATMARADVSDRGAAAEIVDRAAAELGRLDILVNNAGTMFGRTPIADATDKQYDDVIKLNIGSVFFASRRAAQLFRETRTGAIINTTSIAARTGGAGGAGDLRLGQGVRQLDHPLAGTRARAARCPGQRRCPRRDPDRLP